MKIRIIVHIVIIKIIEYTKDWMDEYLNYLINAACEQKKTPFKLTSITPVKSSGFIIIANMSLVIPALLTRISTGPIYCIE